MTTSLCNETDKIKRIISIINWNLMIWLLSIKDWSCSQSIQRAAVSLEPRVSNYRSKQIKSITMMKSIGTHGTKWYNYTTVFTGCEPNSHVCVTCGMLAANIFRGICAVKLGSRDVWHVVDGGQVLLSGEKGPLVKEMEGSQVLLPNGVASVPVPWVNTNGMLQGFLK